MRCLLDQTWVDSSSDVGGLLVDLGHPHGVLRGVEAVEGCRIEVELVAKNDDEGAQPGHELT